MSRGGRGGGQGGRKGGPDMSWQDDDNVTENTANMKRIPGPIFPHRHIPVPKPLSATEKSQISHVLEIRERIRNGPLFAVLDPSQLLDSRGKVNLRAGFDPFNDQERFTQRYHRKRRTVPDHADRGGYTLKFFPVELWPVLDPKKRQKEYWDSLSQDVRARLGGTRTKKRKSEVLKFTEVDEEGDGEGRKAGSGEDSDEDAIIDSGRRRKKATGASRKSELSRSKEKEKKGLDAEDDYPEVEQQDEDGQAGGIGADDEPQDSEFGSDEDDDAYDDYNAENYFDDGAEDDMGDGDDDGGGGGGGGGEYY